MDVSSAHKSAIKVVQQINRWEVTRDGEVIASYATRKEAREAAQREKADYGEVRRG